MSMPEKTAFAGGNALKIEGQYENNKCCGTYMTGDATEGFVGREGM